MSKMLPDLPSPRFEGQQDQESKPLPRANTLAKVTPDKVVLPAFLIKTYEMVNDPQCKQIVHWTDSGLTFIVTKPSLLAKQVLPRYFKHSNFSSFIRQLNMYGFHKYGEPNEWIFGHEHFQRDQAHLLQLIKRKSSSKSKTTANESGDAKSVINRLESEKVKLVDELKRLRSSQGAMQNRLSAVTQLNQSLWKELCECQETQRLMKSNIERIITFLRTVYAQRAQRRITGETGDDDGSPTKRRRIEGQEGETPAEPQTLEEWYKALQSATQDAVGSVPSAAQSAANVTPSLTAAALAGAQPPTATVAAATVATTSTANADDADAVPGSVPSAGDNDAAVPSHGTKRRHTDVEQGVPDMDPSDHTISAVMQQVKQFSDKLAKNEGSIPDAFVDDFFAETLINGDNDDVFVPSL